ncbi:TonB-dependent receptor plug domain-containing protein [Kordiimonas aestuarii]|uniref:TonB-dependent receptor plug domain-containing protein n=1 Tax=Kordiimonas aestuarii TaxID=1005925 RepID=UPI0021D36FFF|nr:TonB-dependent receptor [Kordiimonas aestuarii]
MRHALLKRQLLSSCVLLALAPQAMAQDEAATEQPTTDMSLEEIVVTGKIVTRNRTASVSPELTYDTEFFQKFEPISAGDMLKRVPGVAFTSDIGEYDAPQMRGMADGFTQVLVNGRPVPGAGNDRTVLVDRIPAEIIEKIEVIRSPGADIDSQGVGGTINIILKEGATLPVGGSIRGSALYSAKDKELRGAGAISYAGRSDNERIFYSVTANIQQRFNAKKFVEETIVAGDFPESTDGRDLFAPDDFNASVADGRAVQLDSRENLDTSLNADVTFKVGDSGELRFDGFYIDTNRDEREDTTEWERDDGELVGDKVGSQDTEIRQENFGFSALYEDRFSDTTSFDTMVRYSQFKNTEDQYDREFDFDDGSESLDDRERELIDSTDKEFAADFGIKHELDAMLLKFGASTKFKDRDYGLTLMEADDFGELEVESESQFGVKEKRYDAYLVGEWQLGSAMTIEAGARLEHTNTKVSAPRAAETSNSVTLLNPSLHIQRDVSDNGQLRLSLARTVRRPTFDQLVPAELQDEPDDDDVTVGNPDLAMEKSWGLDLGYEHSLPGNGILGVNFFYRKVSDLSQLVRIGDTEDGGLYSYDNVGNGKTYGIEFDVSTPLVFLGLDETGFFANYTRIWSSRYDEFLQEDVRFNHQPKYVYNVGLTQNFPSIEATTGFSYQKQGLATSVFYAEIEDQYYGGNLEFFIEKRFENGFVLRFTANNLLNAESNQAERNFDGLDDMRAGIVDEFEVERETSTRVFLLTARYHF